MRKLIVWQIILVLMLLMMAPGVYAEEPFRVAGYDSDTQHNWDTNLFFTRMEAETGIQLKLEQYDTAEDWRKAKQAMLAEGADLPDALFKAGLSTDETMDLYQAGKLINLAAKDENGDILLQKHAPNLWALLNSNPEWLDAVTLPGTDAIVALPAINTLSFGNAMWINKSWLDRLGLQVPTTAEELTKVLEAFRDFDANGNHDRTDEIPLTFSGMWDLRFLAHAYGVIGNDYFMTVSEDGKVSQILTTEENRAFLKWMNKLWEDDLLHADGFSGLRDLNDTNDEDAEIVYGVILSYSPAELIPLAKMDQYILLEPLWYEGKQVYRDLSGDIVRGTFAITSACEHPEKLLEWVDYLYTEDGFILSDAGVAGTEFEYIDGGKWHWLYTTAELSNKLSESTIHSGSSMPGIASEAFQMSIDDANTLSLAKALKRLHEVDSMPYPLVYVTDEKQNEIDAIFLGYQAGDSQDVKVDVTLNAKGLGIFAERQMAWFVTGDLDINDDDDWNAFCSGVEARKMADFVAIWQDLYDNAR